MPSVKRIETTFDGVKITTGDDGTAILAVKAEDVNGLISTVIVREVALIEAVEEYASERGLRRRKRNRQAATAAKPRKTRKAKPTPVQQDEAHADPDRTIVDAPAAFAQ